MPILFFCKSIYTSKQQTGSEPTNFTLVDLDKPVDINPLILERYKFDKVLVLVARDSQQNRLKSALLEGRIGCYDLDPLAPYDIDILGWWEVQESEIFSIDTGFIYAELSKYKVVIIVDKERIDQTFLPLYDNLIKVI